MNEVRYFALTLCIIFTCGFFPYSVKAQAIKNDDRILNQWVSNSLQIDGNLKDWSDSLQYFNESTQFSFNLRNDDKAIYLAIKSHNKQNLSRILSRGISFSINTDGKKKRSATVIFPIVTQSSQSKKTNKPAANASELQRDLLSRIRQITVTGFPEILDGLISTKNTYGILAGAAFDDQDNLSLEVAIPFSMLGITIQHDMIACLIEINGIKSPRSAYDPNMDYDPYRAERNRRNRMYGYPSQDYRYGRQPAVNKQNLPTGFWIESTLAKNLNNK